MPDSLNKAPSRDHKNEIPSQLWDIAKSPIDALAKFSSGVSSFVGGHDILSWADVKCPLVRHRRQVQHRLSGEVMLIGGRSC
jgi:hypothetical protein